MCIVHTAEASVLVLRSGKTIVGDILVQNDDVVIIRDASGRRFQYPASEVERVDNDTTAAVQEDGVHAEAKVRTLSLQRKTSIRVNVAGGVALLPNQATGGYVSGDFRVGANNLADKYIEVGGGIGYRAIMMSSKVYSLLPVTAYVHVPMMEGKHVPIAAMSVGYGIGLGSIRGGLTAGVDLGWQYRFSQLSALMLGLNAQFQQVSMSQDITIENNHFITTSEVGGGIFLMGITIGMSF